MGTAQVQGPLWGARAQEWATLQEDTSRPLYEAVFDALGVGPGTHLLDAGCGTGLAAQLAAERGAQVWGIDASPASLQIARGRVPGGDFRCADLEALPLAADMVDVTVGFNAFQYAADPVVALREAARVTRPGGRVVMAVWGQPERCAHARTLQAVGALLPPPPPGTGGPFALSAPGRVAALLQDAGLMPMDQGEAACPFLYPDGETAWRAISAAGPVVRAIAHAGEVATREAVLASLAPFAQPGGGYRQDNVFQYVIGRVGGGGSS